MLDDGPSLRRDLAANIDDADLGAHLRAAGETGIDFTFFLELMPFAAVEVMDPDSLPREPERDGQP